ncbi:MAG: hypothetical protein ACSHYB_01490 [Roseibacillus sp.]
MSPSPAHQFLDAFRRRCTLATGLRALLWCSAGAVAAMLVYAVYWRIKGYQIPWSFYPIIAFWALFIAAMWTLARSLSRREAAEQADQHFGLKDGLASTIQFEEENCEGEVFELQRKAIEERLANQQVSSLPIRTPWKVAFFSMGGLALAIWMATLPNSEAVQSQLDADQAMLERTATVKEQLEEAVEELLEELDEDEKAALDVEQLKEWVKELEETEDQKEALRQLARFEKKIANAMKGLEARKDEETLKLAAAELDKSDLAAARQLGKKLDLKEFKEAAMDLKKLKPNAKNPEGRKLTEEERKKMLEKLREATKRMANGAKGRKNNQMNQNGEPNGKEMQDLADLLDELDQAAEEFDEEMGDLQEIEGEFEMGEFDEAMGKFMGRMKNLDARKKLRGKLGKMRQKLGKSQGFVAGSGQSLQLGKGGLKPGVGTDQRRREGETEMPAEMAAERLKGQKGSGPSQSTVEDADSGAGISGRRNAVQERSFARQMESFVARDDVPEEMKLGVREYFERIHEVEADQGGN